MNTSINEKSQKLEEGNKQKQKRKKRKIQNPRGRGAVGAVEEKKSRKILEGEEKKL